VKSVPLSALEKELLILLVREKIKIIEDKKTDFGTNGRKKKAWNLITEKFNSQNSGGTPRSSLQLKKAWANGKRVAKKQVSNGVIFNF